LITPSTSSELSEDFLEEAQLAPIASEEVDFVFVVVLVAFERFPRLLLVLGKKTFLIFDMVTGIKPKKIVRNHFFPLVSFKTKITVTL